VAERKKPRAAASRSTGRSATGVRAASRSDRSTRYLAHLPASTAALHAREPRLGELLESLLIGARAIWPELHVTEEEFLAHLASRIPRGQPAAEALGAIHGADLYLACGCGKGDRKALREFDRRLLADVPAALSRMRAPPTLIDEVMQLMRKRLLLAEEGRRPRIYDYAGRGPLKRWIRATATRTAATLFRQDRREVSIDEQELELAPESKGTPEDGYIRERYGREFSQAFNGALGRLDAKDLEILKLHLIDGLNFAQISARYRTHRSTVTRWIQSARQDLLDETRKHLIDKLGWSRSEFDALALVIQGDLEITLPLGPATGAEVLAEVVAKKKLG
jgi:RNA polymerase sigma-70 factor (ECF subfamily)